MGNEFVAGFKGNAKEYYEATENTLNKLTLDFKQQSKEYKKILDDNLKINREKVLREIQKYRERCLDFIKLNTRTLDTKKTKNRLFQKRVSDRAADACRYQKKILDSSLREFYSSYLFIDTQPKPELTRHLKSLFNPNKYEKKLIKTTDEQEKQIPIQLQPLPAIPDTDLDIDKQDKDCDCCDEEEQYEDVMEENTQAKESEQSEQLFKYFQEALSNLGFYENSKDYSEQTNNVEENKQEKQEESLYENMSQENVLKDTTPAA